MHALLAPWPQTLPGSGVSGHASCQPGILIIDDDPGLHRLLGGALHERGFAVWQALNADQAVEAYAAHAEAIHLVLSDIHVNGEQGPDVIALLRTIKPDLRCCFMTDDLTPELVNDLTTRGASWVFPRPFPVQAVTSMLWQLACRKRSRVHAKSVA